MSKNILDDAVEGSPIMRALATAARFRRAVRELARDEAEEDFWTTGEEAALAGAEEPMRLAAQDAVVFASGSWRVQVRQRGASHELTLTEGGAGASIRSGSTIVQLHQGVPVDVLVEEGAQSIVLLDARGRQITLSRND